MGASSTLRRGDWKLIYYHPDQRFELFDLAHDLGEKNNLAKADPRRVREMAAELTSLLQQNPVPAGPIAFTGTRAAVKTSTLILSSLSCVLCGFTKAAERKCSILRLLVEDQRWDAMSCMGHPLLTALAAD